MWGEKKELRGSLYIIGGCASLQRRLHTHTSTMQLSQAEVYFARCDQAAEYLMRGKKVSIHLEVLGQFSVEVKQWLVDLHNAIAVECYDPARCFEDDFGPEYKLSVLVKNGKAIASAKQVN